MVTTISSGWGLKNTYLYLCSKEKPLAEIAYNKCWNVFALLHNINPLTPISDQDRISPYNINTISTRKVMRIKKNINLGIIDWSITKFPDLTL